MITHLLDTSVYSQPIARNPRAKVIDRWVALGDTQLAISPICEAEILYGIEKRQSQRLRKAYEALLEDRLILLPVDKAVAKTFAQIKAAQEFKGQPRSDADLLIAATALVHRLTLATLNVRHFTGLPDLNVEDWSGSA